MTNSDLFVAILDTVARECEVSPQDILGSRRTIEIVDARYLLVFFLSFAGFNTPAISRRTNLSPQCINQILRQFPDRRKQSGKLFELTFQRIRNDLEM